MPLQSPPLKERPSILCDWVEIKVLSSKLGEFRLNSLRRLWDINRETEDSDPEGCSSSELDTDQSGASGQDDEAFITSLTTQFIERASVLGSTYPFELVDGSKLRVKGPPDDGGYIYLFCLLLSYSNGKELLTGDWLPQVNNRVRDLFQACATVAAAGHINGCAISFGWPRPYQNPPFLAKLRSVYQLLGEGQLVARPRPGVSPAPKDEEIDIIAWQPSNDGGAGKPYLLGQVASGENWEAKAIHGAPIDNFHKNWFEDQPRSTPIGSIFIPGEVLPINRADSRADRLQAITAKFGRVFDRLRLPYFLQAGIELAQNRAELVVERHEEISEIGFWVNSQIIELQRRSA